MLNSFGNTRIWRCPAILFPVLCRTLNGLGPFREPRTTLGSFIVFSKPRANVPDAEKSRIEFHMQQIAECVGWERFTLPVVSRNTLFELYESKRKPQQVIEFVGDHLAHDVSGIQFRIVPQPTQGSCGSGCGGGSCDGPSGLPGKYDANERAIILEIEIDSDPQMGLATLTNGVVCDLLHQKNFGSAHLPERVDLAVAATGLGMIRNNISLVKKQTNYWDSTQWELFPRPFLDCQSLAYANAIAAWARDDATPEWAGLGLTRPLNLWAAKGTYGHIYS